MERKVDVNGTIKLSHKNKTKRVLTALNILSSNNKISTLAIYHA